MLLVRKLLQRVFETRLAVVAASLSLLTSTLFQAEFILASPTNQGALCAEKSFCYKSVDRVAIVVRARGGS